MLTKRLSDSQFERFWACRTASEVAYHDRSTVAEVHDRAAALRLPPKARVGWHPRTPEVQRQREMTDRRILRLFGLGATHAEVAGMIGVHKRTVQNRLRANGALPPPRRYQRGRSLS
jgi:hypothetical protein